MEQKGKIDQKLQGRQILTQALTRSLEVLQLPSLELGMLIEQEIEKNPLLELISPSPPSSRGQLPEVSFQPSLYDHLLSQVRENFSLPWERRIAQEWIESLDEKGFVSIPIDTMANRFGLTQEQISNHLKTLQTFSPAGIFAQSLQECFLIQLERMNLKENLAYQIVLHSYDDLLHKRYSMILKQHKTTSSDLKDAIGTLSRLSTRPASGFLPTPAQTIIPDLRIYKIGSKWFVEPITDSLPKFRLKTEYLSLQSLPKDQQSTLRFFLKEAKWLIQSLSKRSKLILSLTSFLVKKQTAFLNEKGPLIPISGTELAARFGVHESTISRALSEKYLDSPKGIIPLGSLVPSSSNEAGKELLQKLIETEDKRSPLTDDELAIEMGKAGYKMARRTISKYRKELHISSASSRKNAI